MPVNREENFLDRNSPYGTAQICLNGHVIVDAIEEYRYDMKTYWTNADNLL